MNSYFRKCFLPPIMAYLCILPFCSSVAQAGERDQPAPPMVGVYYFDGWSGRNKYADDPKQPWAVNAPTHLTRRMVEEFPGREPLWGWRNDSVQIMERQIDLAADHGISFFAFCWYWHDNGKTINLEAILNNPRHTSLALFLKASNNHRMKFCLLVANHKGAEIIGADNWRQAAKFWTPYFTHKQYVTVSGKPLIIVFNPAGGNKEGFAAMNAVARAAKMPGLAIAGCGGGAAENGFTHRTHYNLAPCSGPPPLEQNYKELIAANQSRWAGRSGQPYLPIVTAGWDNRPWEGPNGLGKPARCYFTDKTPELFANYLRNAIHWMNQHPSQTTAERILLIYAWNELGEGGYLVPTQADPSASYLQTLQATLNSSRQTGSSFPSAGSQ